VFRGTCDAPGDAGAGGGSAHVTRAPPLQVIGTIQTATGLVTVMDAQGVVAQVKVGDPVYRHDTIETGADGAVGIAFIDGTAFKLSNNARMALNEFVCDGTSNSALFNLGKGAFSFIAGKVAKTGGLKIDTPFARIRGAAQDGGIGILTLAALAFSTIREIQAASRSDAFLDDGTITYKDSPHGTFEITTRDGRVIVADDPGETIVVDPTGSVTRTPNSASRMAELQFAQTNTLSTLSLGLGQQGAAPGGSSTPTFNIPLQPQPINFSQPENHDQARLTVTINATPTNPNQGVIDIPLSVFQPPPVTPPNPGLAANVFGAPAIIEVLNTTGSTKLDTAPAGSLTFTDFNVTTVSASLASITWSGGATLPSALSTVLASALTTSVSTNSSTGGSILATFSAADDNFDFLAAGETLVITYNVTAADNHGLSLSQPVTIVVTGSNDAPVLAADASGPHTTTQDVNASGTLTFTDVDLNDHHTVSTSLVSMDASGGATPPSGIGTILAGALSTTTADSTGSGSGLIAFTFDAAGALDFLAAGQKLTITYNVTVTDNNGLSSTQPVTITIIGINHAPVLAPDASGPHTIPEALNTTGSTSLDSASGTLSFTDVDLDDHHTASASAPTFAWSGGTLTAAQLTALTAASTLKLSETDSTGSGAGSIGFSYSAADRAFDFLAAGQTLTITYNLTVSDGTASSTQPVTIAVTGTNDAPVLDAHSGSLSYTENQAATAIDTAITVSDVDSANLAGATVQITGNFVFGQDVLGFANQNGIAGSYNAVTGVLTLTGHASVAQYQAALQSVTYFNSSDNPSSQTRTISYQVNDGSAQNNLSNVATATVAVTPVNDALVAVDDINWATAGTNATGNLLANDIDVPNASLSVTGIQGGGAHGSLNVNINDGSYTYVVNKSDPAVQALNTGGTLTDTFTYTVQDSRGLTATAQLTITISADDAPVLPAGSTTNLNGGTLQASFIDVEGTVIGFGTIIANIITNNGTITANSDTLTISGSIQGTGLLKITNDTTLALDGPVGSGQTVQFGNGPAPNLVLNDPSHFQGQITGFQGSDQIDLPTIHFDSGTTTTFTGGILTIKEGTTTVAAITFVGSPNLKITNDGHGGTLITDPPPSTTTPDATVTPVAQTPTLIATEATGTQKKVTVATVDEATAVALNTAVAVAVARLDDSGASAMTDGAQPAHPHSGVNQSAGFKFADEGSTPPAHATGKDASLRSTLADNGHHAVADPEINLASITPNHLPEHPTDNSFHMPAQLDGNGVLTVTDGAHPADLRVDVNQLPSFKFADDGSTHSAHATSKDASVQSTPADNGHHAIADPQISLASIAPNHLPEHPADNSLHMPAQLDGNGVLTVTDGAHPADLPVDVNQLPSFKFAEDGSTHPAHATSKDASVQSTPADNGHYAIADPDSLHMPAQLDGNGVFTGTDRAHPADLPVDVNQLPSFKFAVDGSTHPGTATYGRPTLTELSGDLSGDHGPAAPALAKTFNVPGTVMSDAASDKFIFGQGFNNTIADHKPDMTEIDHTVPAAIQHILDTAHDTNAVSALDPNHATALQDMTKVQLPHHQGDFHFA
jgi:VCBS repeat-containing protein